MPDQPPKHIRNFPYFRCAPLSQGHGGVRQPALEDGNGAAGEEYPLTGHAHSHDAAARGHLVCEKL